MATRLTQTELADRLGLSTRQIHNLEKEAVITKHVRAGKPYYEWPKARDAYLKWKIATELRKQRPANIDDARARKEAALAERAEIEVAQLRGELVPRAVHEERVESLAQRLAGRCKGLGRYIPDVQRAVSDLDAQLLLDRVSDDLLRSLAGVADEIEAEAERAAEEDARASEDAGDGDRAA